MGKSDSYINAQGVRISKATGKPVKKYTKRDTALHVQGYRANSNAYGADKV